MKIKMNIHPYRLYNVITVIIMIYPMVIMIIKNRKQ